MKRLNTLPWLAAALLISAELPAEALFVNDATVYTMSSQGVLQGADILIRDGRIKAVGSELPVPVDATVIEARGRPVTPGFFAGITQLGLVEISLEASSVASLHPVALRRIEQQERNRGRREPHPRPPPQRRIDDDFG